jgi:HD superfamily phosphohydrolase
MGAKIFRDPLYNYIRIEQDRDRWLLELLDCPEVQRLRRIHQLGISYLTYPSATHNRLAHSLGVMHLMQEALGHLAGDHPELAGEEIRQPLLAAALVHDVGHGPFSHLFEPFQTIDHEAWSCSMIRSSESRLFQVLRRIDGTLPEMVAALIETVNPKVPLWQKNLLASQLDVDRLDYLRRDSLFTGAGYGHFDWFRLLHTFTLHQTPGHEAELVWTDKALYAIEEYIFARFYMYQNVYLHKTTRGFEKMLQALWTHAQRLHADGRDVGLLPAVADFWQSPSPSIREYLALEEFVVLTQLQAWADHSDAALSDLARRFFNRQRFAAVDVPVADNRANRDEREWQQALEELAAQHGFTPVQAYVLRDDVENTWFTAYVPGKDDSQFHTIRLLVDAGEPPVEISQLLARLQAVTAESARPVRYYVPKELQPAALALRRRWRKAQ